MSRTVGFLAAAAVAGCLAGCSNPSSDVVPPDAASSTTTTAAATATPSASATAAVTPHVSKLMVVVLENHSRAQALTQMPLLAGQAARYGQATQWYAVAHPSLPNYLMLAGGSTFGVRDSGLPARHPLTGPSVFGQLAAHGHSVRAYAEGMATNCAVTNQGRYVARHNPWTYFADAAERLRCRQQDVPSGSATRGRLRDDVLAGRLPTYSMLIPDLCNDAHDCRLSVADEWLAAWLTRIEAGPDFRTGRLAVVVTFDEDDLRAGNHVATVVIAAQLHHRVVNRRFTHASLAAAPSRLVGLPALRQGAGTPDVLHEFGLR